MGSRSCGDCSRFSENRHFDCPPRMSDGRMFTDYSARCDVNFVKSLQESGQALDSYGYRQYLLNNADSLMDEIRNDVYMKAKCGPCVEPVMRGTMLEEKEIDVCNDRTCTRKLTGKSNGIGLGRWYGDENAENKKFTEFKTCEQEELKAKANCCGTPADYGNYYPPGSVVPASSINRYASIGGGTPLTGGDLLKF